SCGGVFDNYAMIQGVDQFIPVDVYLPGCPPRPETLIDGIMKIQELVQQEHLKGKREKKLVNLENKELTVYQKQAQLLEKV
ncbi:MAG: hypothetical protein AABZ60_08805, partial [Planctomycetota bacterium]